MKKVFKVLLFIILLIPFCVNAKEVTIKGNIHGDGNGDYFTSVIEVDDGYIAASYSYADEVYGIPELGAQDIRIFKYKKDTLEVEWQKIYGGSTTDYAYDMVKMEDGFVIAGSSYSNIDGLTEKGGNDAIIVKFDFDGNVVWQKNWGGSTNEEFFAIKRTQDGGFIAVGYAESTDIEEITNKGFSDAIIVKYDKDGNLAWQNNFGGNSSDYFSEVVATSEGYIVIGETYSTDIDGIPNKGNSDAIIVKYDLQGKVQWQKSLGGNQHEWFDSLAVLEDESIMVIGDSASTDITGITNKGQRDAIVVKYDKDGNLLWQKNWGGNNYDGFNKIKLIKSNELIVLGYTSSNDIEGFTNDGSVDGIVLKYDMNGNLVEQYSFGGNDYDEFEDIIMTEKGYVIVGCSASTDLQNLPYDGGYQGALILEYTINYDLQKETDTIKNGTYDLKQVGQRAEISINPDNGYELDNIIVTDTNGNQLSYYEENGKYYVDLKDDIIVDVKYKQKPVINPNTTGLIMLGEAIILLSILFGSNYFIKKRNSTI